MTGLTRAAKLAHAMDMLKRAHPEPARIRETTPPFGGLRERDVEILVAEGKAEWVEHGVSAKLKEEPHDEQR